jgi:hypothetical protein
MHECLALRDGKIVNDSSARFMANGLARRAAAQAQMPTWRVMVHACFAAQAALNSKEREFLHSLLTWRGTRPPSRWPG